MNHTNYINSSLQLHLFFDRILKEHCLFLEVSFTDKNQDFKKIARRFEQTFSEILNDMIDLANGNISNDLINSNELVTKNTLDAEIKTSQLTGILINTNLTMKEWQLRCAPIPINDELIKKIHHINEQTLSITQQLIQFKNDILNDVQSSKLYTTNYPLMIRHLMNEAKMYYTLLSKLENNVNFSLNELYEQELFWNDMMKEHAQFIRGLLDPSEHNLFIKSNEFAVEYEKILQSYQNDFHHLANVSLEKTLQFKDFKILVEEGILNNQIKSIISPLLADHIVREANHFLRILNAYASYNNPI